MVGSNLRALRSLSSPSAIARALLSGLRGSVVGEAAGAANAPPDSAPASGVASGVFTGAVRKDPVDPEDLAEMSLTPDGELGLAGGTAALSGGTRGAAEPAASSPGTLKESPNPVGFEGAKAPSTSSKNRAGSAALAVGVNSKSSLVYTNPGPT